MKRLWFRKALAVPAGAAAFLCLTACGASPGDPPRTRSSSAVQAQVNSRTDDRRASDAETIAYREERCGPSDTPPLDRGPHDPALKAAFKAAARSGRWDEVRWYLYKDVPTPEGLTGAERARVRREQLSLALFKPARRGDAREIRRLLRVGADPNTWIQLDDVATPLAWAAGCNHVEAVRALLDGGANVNQRFWWGHGASWSGSTPAVFAATYGSADALKLLIERGADVNADMTVRDRYGVPEGRVRILDWADTSEVRRILVASGAVPSRGDRSPARSGLAPCEETARFGEGRLYASVSRREWNWRPPAGSSRASEVLGALLRPEGLPAPQRGRQCIWRVGQIRADGSRSYTVYIRELDRPADYTTAYSLFLVDDQNRFAGLYAVDEAIIHVERGSVIFDGVAAIGGDRLTVTSNGIPGELVIDGKSYPRLR